MPFASHLESGAIGASETAQTVHRTYLAVDLGASSGRVTAVHFDGDAITMNLVTRFPNHPIEAHDGSLRWDFPRLVSQVQEGITTAVDMHPDTVVSVAVSGWGVDYGLVDRSGGLVEPPFSYRDGRTSSTPSKFFDSFDEYQWYRTTGVATMPINTLFQLMWAVEHQHETLDRAHHLLLIPDLVSRELSGEAVTERTIASTSQMLDIRSGSWHREELSTLGIPGEILSEPCPSGTVVVGPDSPIGRLTGRGMAVVAAASHDTASAFVGSGAGTGEAVLSSGTWALMGVLGAPQTSELAFASGISNEYGADGQIRTLRNLTGLWIVQECLRVWREDTQNLDFDTLMAEATAATPFLAVIDTNDPRFAVPDDMPAKIQDYCRLSGQPVPETRGELTRIVLESLAIQFRRTLRTLEQITGDPFRVIRVVGGGTHHDLLNTLTASATGVPVTLGHPEATTLGNALVQMVATGAIDNYAEARELVGGLSGETYQPTNEGDWEAAEKRLDTVAA